MATRADIRDAFYSELLSAVATSHTVTYGDGSTTTVTLTDGDVKLQDPAGLEELPGVVYSENYSLYPYNDAGAGPDAKEYDANGDVAAEVWREYIEAHFIVDIRASSEPVKEPIYEAARSAFKRYRFAPWPYSDLHADVFDVDVMDATSEDVGAAEDTIRGDQLNVFIRFHRDYTLSTDNIETVEQTVEGSSYTTS